jgi:sugar lactone lactonase YvrE
MKLFFVFTVLLSFLGNAFSDETAPVVATLYAGPVSSVGIWSDAKGNIYGCETSFHSVFKITAGGVKTDFAGTRGTAGVASEGVLAGNALLKTPRAVWGDGQFLYVTDSVNNRIRRVSWTTSLVTTVVGGGTGSILTSGSFPGTSVALTLPNAIAGSSNGKVYFADFGHVYVLDTETGLVGMVSFVAGGGDHIGTFAHGAQVSLKDIQGLAVDPTNNHFLFVADSGNKVVRKMNVATGHSMIFAGRVKKENFLLPSKPFENGEAAYKVKLGNPSSVWVGDDGSVFIADSLFHTISVVRHNKIYLFAGKWSSGAISNTLMTGPANQVQIEASHIFGDSSKGVLYLSDATRGGIQQISPLNVNVYVPTAAPTVTPTAKPTNDPTQNPTRQPTSQPTGQPSNQPSGQPVSQPTSIPIVQTPLITKTNLDGSMLEPAGVWVDASGNVFVANNDPADEIPSRVYKQSAANGKVSIFAGSGGTATIPGKGEKPVAASLAFTEGIWGDSDNLYICDWGNLRVQAVNFATNEMTTIAGSGGYDFEIEFTEPQPATDLGFAPLSIWGDGEGHLYILTDTSQVLLYSMDDQKIQLLAYSSFGAQLTVGEEGSSVGFLDLARTEVVNHISGDASKKCLYVSEQTYSQTAIVRKLDLASKTATIFAGQLIQGSYEQYTDGAQATDILFSGDVPPGLWVATDGTVFVGDAGTSAISAINPNTNEITWFAGTWMDWGEAVGRADEDKENELRMNGPAKQGVISPFFLSGNSQLNTLYLGDWTHSAVRKISPLLTSPALPSLPITLDGKKVIPSTDHFTPRLRKGSASFRLRGSV